MLLKHHFSPCPQYGCHKEGRTDANKIIVYRYWPCFVRANYLACSQAGRLTIVGDDTEPATTTGRPQQHEAAKRRRIKVKTSPTFCVVTPVSVPREPVDGETVQVVEGFEVVVVVESTPADTSGSSSSSDRMPECSVEP